LRLWSRCPLTIGIDRGGYLRRRARESPGKDGRKPFCRANSKMEREGEKRAAWAKATSSAGVAEPMVAWAESGHGVGLGGVGRSWRSKCQRRVNRVRWPRRTMAFIVQMWVVLPVSAMAGEEVEHEARTGGDTKGGPIERGASEAEADKAVVRANNAGTNTFLAGATGATIGFPLGHGPGAVALGRGPRCWAPRV
jgi:hypothetical protein